MIATTEVTATCPSCGTANRLDPGRAEAGQQPACGKCGKPLAAAGKPVETTDASFEADVLRSPVPVLVDVWAPWCGPCRMLAPALEALAEGRTGTLRVAKLNADDNQVTPSRLGVRGIPTMILFRDGQEVDRAVGALPKDGIARWLDVALG
jgi:thioredoxin 2